MTAEVDGEHTIFHDDLLDKFVGKWNVRGTIVGQEIEQDCDIEWALNHQFLKVHFVGRQSGETKDPRYEAIVFIGNDNMSERYVAHWLDTFGGRFSEVLGFGSRTNDSIKFVFDGMGGVLHNTITYNSGKWRMLIEQKNSKGEWYTFADESFEKVA